MSMARLGEWVRLIDRNGNALNCQVVSVTESHVVVRMKDGKLWAMARNDFVSMRAMGEK
jgi:hypothetical protein